MQYKKKKRLQLVLKKLNENNKLWLSYNRWKVQIVRLPLPTLRNMKNLKELLNHKLAQGLIKKLKGKKCLPNKNKIEKHFKKNRQKKLLNKKNQNKKKY